MLSLSFTWQTILRQVLPIDLGSRLGISTATAKHHKSSLCCALLSLTLRSMLLREILRVKLRFNGVCPWLMGHRSLATKSLSDTTVPKPTVRSAAQKLPLLRVRSVHLCSVSLHSNWRKVKQSSLKSSHKIPMEIRHTRMLAKEPT